MEKTCCHTVQYYSITVLQYFSITVFQFTILELL